MRITNISIMENMKLIGGENSKVWNGMDKGIL